VVWTVRQLSRFGAVLGSWGRSGYQRSAWETVYGPTDEDGYPRPLWDKLTGRMKGRSPRTCGTTGTTCATKPSATGNASGPGWWESSTSSRGTWTTST
jgi:hypothetical protein